MWSNLQLSITGVYIAMSTVYKPGYIKTHDSESRGQEEAATTE